MKKFEYFTSGFVYDECYKYVVDSNSYSLKDDKTCFRLSKSYHKIGENLNLGEFNYVYAYIYVNEDNKIYFEWLDSYKDDCYVLRLYDLV